MGIQVKLYIEPDHEIRRFTLESVASFSAFYQQVRLLVERDNFRMFWQDSEGDSIVCGSDEELVAALQTIKDSSETLKIVVRPTNKQTPQEAKKLHPNVVCDGCRGSVIGIRFKCIACPDFDLCEKCQDAGTHSEHDMVLIRGPGSENWKKFFANGTRPGHCGPRRHGHCQRPSGMGPQQGAPSGGPPGFMPPFWGPTMGGFPFPPAFEQTLEMDVDANRPFPEVIADVTKKVMDALRRAQGGGEQTEQTETPESGSGTQEAANLVAATVVNAASQVAEIIQQAFGGENVSETETRKTEMQTEPVEGESVKTDKRESQSSQASSTQPTTPLEPSRDDRIEAALRTMEEMGFPTEGNLMRRLLQNHNGDIARVLDSIK